MHSEAPGEQQDNAHLKHKESGDNRIQKSKISATTRHSGVRIFLLFALLGVVLGNIYRDQLILLINSRTKEQVSAAHVPVSEIRDDTIPALPSYTETTADQIYGIPRYAVLYTTIPNRPRVDVITYTVVLGDSVFGIAEKHGLNPETIFWANYDVLEDNPHRLKEGQILKILPVNGTYHKWTEGESFTKVAEFYKANPEDVAQYPGNHLDPYAFDIENPEIEDGTMLIIPSGQRELVDWGPPRIPRDNPAVARTYGPGFCGQVYDGPIGDGYYIWPTTERWISGYDYNPSANHPAIDIAGSIGNPVWAVDDGVVVYAGWSYYGYGNLVVIDHGNGWQSLYAHLNTFNVGCGQGVFQGTVIGGLGTTGMSSGPHLHFELMWGSGKVNPWNFLP